MTHTPTPTPASAGMHRPSPSIWATAQTTGPAQRRGRYVPESVGHPAKMLPAIAAHAIAHYTRPGEVVLDPMCGIGTTLVEAMHQSRRAVGVEYEAHWAEIAAANTRLATRQGAGGRAVVINGDARRVEHLAPQDVRGRVALVVTSPPYGASVHGQILTTRDTGTPKIAKYADSYGPDHRDRGNLANTGPDLLTAFTRILAGCRALLRPGGHIVITTRPWRHLGELVDLPCATIAAGEAAGLIPVERCIALLAGLRDGELVARPTFFALKNVRDARTAGIPQHLIVHEDVIVLRRPNPT
ncbi:TRM11 family SAM-dependent methyltransferase [Embleya sp. NPDC059237]|uniref:TRM11 family SAM-dependent methyltransferase n=1 Tax=Embleya sp. NPDC059237 TaxID=3346784 RepID=UPI0036CAAA3A